MKKHILIAANILQTHPDELPEDLLEILDRLEEKYKKGKAWKHAELGSAQLISLVVMLWELGIFKIGKRKINEVDHHVSSEFQQDTSNDPSVNGY